MLKRCREIGQLFIDGLVGKNFSKALALHLDNFESCLTDLKKLGKHKNSL